MTGLNKVNVTYKAPEGDSKVVEMMNHTFFDGQPTDLICTKDQFDTISTNPHFKVNSNSVYDPAAEPKAEKEKEHKAEHKK